MFYHSGVIIAPSHNFGTFAGHVDKKSRLEETPRKASLRRSTARLRKVRWTIYKQIRFNDEAVWRSLGYYKSLVMRFLRRFSAKLKPREPRIWKEKLSKTVQDVTKLLQEKSKHKFTCKTSTTKSKSASNVGPVFDASSKTEKNENVLKKKAQIARNVKTLPQHKCTCYSIMSDYMPKVDSALLMISTILYLVRNEQAKSKDPAAKVELYEVPAHENVAHDPIEETFDTPVEDLVPDILHPVHVVENSVANIAVEMLEASTEDKSAKKTATLVQQGVNTYGVKVTWSMCPQLRHFPVSECRRRCELDVITRRDVDPSYLEVKPALEPVNKDSEEYQQRIKNASNKFLAALGVLNKICPCGLHLMKLK